MTNKDKKPSLFEQVLDKYLADNPLPKNKTALRDYIKGFNKMYRGEMAKKANVNRTLSPEQAKRMNNIKKKKKLENNTENP